MLDRARVEQIAQAAADDKLGDDKVDSVIVEMTTDSEGHDALRITLVVKPGLVGKLTGDGALDTLYKIQTELSHAGEERLAIVEYATRKELEKIGSSKS